MAHEDAANGPETVAVARRAMNTRFEILLHGPDPVSLRAAGEEALAEIEGLEDRLSLFRPTSEISRLNREAADHPVRVSAPVFELLEQVQLLCRETDGAFDPTVGPLLRCWGFLGERGRVPSTRELAMARDRVGMSLVRLDEKASTVRFLRDGVMLDLGAIGKGYAIDCAVEILRDVGVTCAFLHGGTSSSFAIGSPPDLPAWKVTVDRPGLADPKDEDPRQPAFVAEVSLKDESLGVSESGSKAFTSSGTTYGHVIDPRSGVPTRRAALAAVVLRSATETDAFSTALMCLGVEGIELLGRHRTEMRALVVRASGEDALEVRGSLQPPGFES